MGNEKTAYVIVVTFLLARLCTYVQRLIIAHCCCLAVHMALGVYCFNWTQSSWSLSDSYNEGAVVPPPP